MQATNFHNAFINRNSRLIEAHKHAHARAAVRRKDIFANLPAGWAALYEHSINGGGWMSPAEAADHTCYQIGDHAGAGGVFIGIYLKSRFNSCHATLTPNL